jgi:hypothetical protein
MSEDDKNENAVSASVTKSTDDATKSDDEFAGLTFGQKAARVAKRAAHVRVKKLVHEKLAPLIMAQAEKGFFFHVVHLEGEEADFVGNSGNLQVGRLVFLCSFSPSPSPSPVSSVVCVCVCVML